MVNLSAKEVENYVEALRFFQRKLGENNLITVRTLTDAQKIIKGNDAGIRVQIGTVLKNETTHVIYFC